MAKRRVPDELAFLVNRRAVQKTTEAAMTGKVCIISGATSGVGLPAHRARRPVPILVNRLPARLCFQPLSVGHLAAVEQLMECSGVHLERHVLPRVTLDDTQDFESDILGLRPTFIKPLL